MRGLSVQVLTLRQLGQLSSPQLMAVWSRPCVTAWCPRTLHARQLWGSTGSAAPRITAPLKPWDGPPNWALQQARMKSFKGKGRRRVSNLEEEEEEEEEEKKEDPEASDYEDELQDDSDLPKDYKDIEKAVQSLRYDLVLKAGLDVARNKIEDAMYACKLRLNGQTLTKKSRNVKVGDALDLITEEDSNTITVQRVILKKVTGETQDGSKQRVILRRWKHLRLPKREAPVE